MAFETTTYGPRDKADKKPKWQVTPFNFAKVKKVTEPKTEQPVIRQDNGIVQDQPNQPIEQTTDQPKLGMGDLKQAESEGTVDFFDQKPPRNINDLYQTPQDATKAPVYDYNKLNDLPITKKVYKERINNPENREPTYPISQPVETPSGSYEAADMEPKLQEEEIRQKAEIVNKINSGEINIPPFVSSLPMDMQLGYVGATYNNNPLYTSLTTLMEPLLHLDNLVRSGMNKAFSTDYKMLTPPNMSGEDEDDKLITGGTELLTSLIPLGASIKGANYLLRGVKNPFLNKILSTGLGFVINSQPALLDNLQQGNMELKDYAMQSATDFVTGLTFGAMPPGMPLKYDIPYQTVVPTMVPVISDLIQGKPVDEKEIVNGFLSNMILGLVMSGQLPKNTKVDEVSRQVKTELNKYNEAQQTPELVNQIISGLLGPARETNSETISRIKTGEKPSIEQINIPGDKSRIVVDEKGTAQIDPEREAQPYIAPIKLTEEQYNDMKRGGLTDAEIREAQDYLNGKINRTEKTTDPENIVRQDNGIKPENNSLKSEPEKPAEQPPVKTEPEREYKTVKLDAEDIGSKYIVDEKGNMFVVKKEKEGYYEKYVLYRKTPEQTQPERLSSFMNEHSVNLGLRSWAEGDMFLKSRPADKVEQQKPADERTTQQKKAEDAYSNMLDLRDEVNSVKKSDLSGRANKSNNIRLLKKNVDDYNANHPDNKAKIERTKWGTYNIFINGKPLRRESVKREFNVEDKAGEIDNPNANKPYKELGAEEREVQRKIAQNIIDADPSVVKNRAGFETPMKVFRKGLEDIKDDSGKEQSPEAQIVRQEMLEKTDNGKEYREKVSEPEKNNGQDNRIDTNNYELNNFVGEKYYPNETKAKKEHDLGIEVYSYTIKKYRKAFDGEKNVDAFDIELSNGNIKTLKAEDVITQILSDKNSFKPDNNGLIKTKNGRHNGIKNEEKNLFEKMSLAEIEKHVNDKAKELGSRADYLRSDEYKELIKPVYDKLLEQRKKDLISKVKSVKEEAKNNVISKQEYKSKMDNIKHEMQMKEERLKEKVEEKPVPKPEMKEEAKQDQPEGTTKKQAEEIINDFGEKLFGSRKDEATPLGKRTRTKNSDLKKGDYEALEMTEADSNGMELRIGSDINSETGTGKYMIVKDGSILMKDVPNRDMAARMLSAMVVKDKFKVYKKADEDYRIYKRFANGKIADVPTLTFKNEADAKIYMIQKADELLEMSKFEHFKRPHLEKLERIGDKTREGNATPKMFTDTFGFRGVEFGKWVENAERQDILNQAYDSFHDLAKILKLPPEALSLNGELGIGFGSRGHGGFNSATAHYEPKRVVINLTKLKGDGSLAHEYFHALDNYFYLIDNEVKLDRDEKGVLKNSRGLFKSEYSNTGKLNKVLANKFHDIYEQLSKREEVREVNLNKEKARLDTMNNNLKEALDYTRDFLSKPDKYRKKKAAATPEQLKRIDELNARILKGDYGDRVYIQPNKRSMYDLGRNTFKYIEELSIIYKTVTGREGWKAYRGLDEIGHAVKRISDQKARYEAYLKDNKENVKVKSKYVEEALKLDQMRGSPYYTKTIELMARAFESYAYDKITESGKRSDYLVHSVENKYFPPSALFGIKIKPYPEGVERTNINKAFDSFFEKLNQYSEYKEGLKLEYEEAKSLLKKTILSDRADFLGLSRLGDLADTKVLKAIYKVGEYHLESGLVKFGDWAKKMVKELGDKVKPHLKKIWNEINKDRTGLKNVVTQGYAGRQALGYEKAKEGGKVFKNPYDKKERFEIDDSEVKLKEINPGKIALSNTAKIWDDAKVYDFSKVMIKGNRIYDANNAYVDNFNEDFKSTLSNPFNSMEDMIDFYKNKEYKEGGTLKGILDHPELYRNYPEAEKIKIEIDDSEDWTAKALGNYNPKTNTITLSSDILKHTYRLKSVLLHEIQHAIQQVEGFAKGGNANMFNDVNTKYKLLSKLKDVASSLFDQLPEDLKNDARKVNREDDTDGSSLTKIQNNPDAKAIWADYLNARKQIEEINNTPDNKFSIETARDQYKKLAGEIESRDVQARMNLTKEQRDPNSPEYVAPYSSENISPEDAIVRYDGTEPMSSMKLKDKDGEAETFEQYKKRIAKEYGTVPTREEYNDAKQLKITGEKVQEKSDVKTELEGVLNDVVNAPVKEKTLDELRSRTSKRKKNAPANEVYMDKVYSKMNEIQADMEKRGYKGQSLLNQSEIQSIKHLFNNDPEFKKFKAEQKRAIVREVKNYYKEEYRKRTAANAVLGEEYQDKNVWHRLKNSSFLQSRNHIARQGPSGKEMAERFKHMADQERELMGEPSGLLLDIEGLSKAEKNNLEKIWEQKMNEQIPMNYLNDNVKNLDAKIDDYFENMANMYKERGFITRNLLTGDVYGFTPKRDYRPRIMNDKVSELELKEDNSGIPKANKQREKVIDFLIETRQAKDRAAAAILLDNELSKHRIRKAGNVEYSRNEKLRLPDEYYVTDPTKSLLSYAKKVSKRVAFVDSWGMEGQIFNRLRDDLYKEGRDYQRANDLFRYETGQLTAKERKSLHDVNNVKALMALTKFSPFTSLRNAFQGFLGTTTRGNLKAGFTGLVNSLKPTIIKNAYEAGVMADNLEGVFKDTAGSGNNNFLGDLTTKYLDLIKFTATDRYNRVISGVGGLSFMEDMMKRIKKDSVWKRRARREFEKLNIDPDKVIENGGFTQAEKNKIMRTFAFDSQFSLRPQDLPLWWSSPMGKMVTQWKPWGYKMTQLIRDNVISEVRHGNIAPLVTMLTAYGITGEAVNYIIDNIRSTANFNPNEDDKKKETPNEKSLIGKINEGDLDGVTKRVIEDLSGLGAMSMYWDIIRSYGYGKYGQGISVLAGPAYGEAGSIVENVFGPTLKKLALKSNDPWEDVTKKTIKGLFKSTTGNVPGAGTFRTLGITKALEDYLFKNDEPNFQDDSVIGEYYKGLDDPGKEEVKKIKEMEKDLKAFREQVLSNPTKEMQREFQKKESEIKRYKDKSRVWYNYTKIKSTKEKEESKKLGK